jgi:hypothetical protein
MAPARAKVSKGLLIEPHFLERNKNNPSDIFIPFGIGLITWFIANNYFEEYDFTNDTPFLEDIIVPQTGGEPMMMQTIAPQVMQPMTQPIAPQVMQPMAYPQLMKKGITLPNIHYQSNNIPENIPDMLMENY